LCTYYSQKMSHKIQPDQVVQYIRDTLEPVRYETLASKFCNYEGSEQTKTAIKNQLRDVLLSQVKSGHLMHYNNYFFAATMEDDLQDALDDEEELPLGSSKISISSCESIESKSSLCEPNKKETDVKLEPKKKSKPKK
ncbi:hypothetical protein KR044_011860, partial [Drosophila immigrans]